MVLKGFGNHHQTEALAGALPETQNAPQACPYGLYAEQLSGSSFTRPRALNLHSWVYRTYPSVVHSDYTPYGKEKVLRFAKDQAPNPYRWSPFLPSDKQVDFIDGLFPVAGNHLTAAYWYHCQQSMQARYFSNHDAEMLLVPYRGSLNLFTEFGHLNLTPGMIAVIPRGVIFKVELLSDMALGYLCENYQQPLTLPNLGALGANALANPRHFIYPEAAFEDLQDNINIVCKANHRLWACQSQHSPLNVVAWQGNYAPYTYDLSLFNTINTVSFDHPDPSIFTVLTSESSIPGIANLDFVIFPPRWLVAEHTFRPPYFHRNLMSEFMGLIEGQYDAKQEGFLPGGISIHNRMVAHGPDAASYQQALAQPLKPQRLDGTLAFMFETAKPWKITENALKHPCRQHDYSSCWQGLKQVFLR